MENLRRIKRTVGRSLRDRWESLAKAEQELLSLRMECDGIAGKEVDLAGDRRMQNTTGDKTGRIAIRLVEAEEKFDRCRKWCQIGSSLSVTLGTTFDGRVFDLAFDNHMSDKAIARKLGCSRLTVISSREKIIFLASVAASQYGLIKAEEVDEHGFQCDRSEGDADVMDGGAHR